MKSLHDFSEIFDIFHRNLKQISVKSVADLIEISAKNSAHQMRIVLKRLLNC